MFWCFIMQLKPFHYSWIYTRFQFGVTAWWYKHYRSVSTSWNIGTRATTSKLSVIDYHVHQCIIHRRYSKKKLRTAATIQHARKSSPHISCTTTKWVSGGSIYFSDALNVVVHLEGLFDTFSGLFKIKESNCSRVPRAESSAPAVPTPAFVSEPTVATHAIS